EYIWIDGTEPTPQLRSKTKVLDEPSTLERIAGLNDDYPIWGFDGSSTNQATGDKSDCVLKPVASYPDPIRGGDDKLVMCEVMLVDGKPHPTNTRAAAARTAKKYKKHDSWFGIEQEYTFFKDGRPLGFPPAGFPAAQGGYYCGVGDDEIHGREIVEDHMNALITAGIALSGINAEVMPGQWEFQIGPLGPLEVSDQLWVARWLLYRLAENYGVTVTLDAKPVKGDWNGAGAHTNFSTLEMREDGGYKHIEAACKALGKKTALHIANYGVGVEDRLTGAHETQRHDEFSYGVSDRGASIRIPWQVAVDKKGYLEDRRPNANIDPYVVTRLMVDTVCSAMK
ncbi:MAG: glutamine synthetase GlnII, partial [Acidimicrobiia bacterium]|nr:glutamine synthetase GlnII [Acidimicrobiia bacterium]